MPDRALTDAELTSIFQNPKADLSLLSADEQQRLVGLTQHLDTKADPAVEKLGAVARFAEGAIKTNPITTGVDFLSQLATSPTAAAKAVIDPSVEYLHRAVTATRAGQPVAALGEAASAIPLVGPYVRGGVDQMRSGDVAGGLGALSWLASPMVKKGAGLATDTAVAGGKMVAPELLNRTADMLDQTANEKLARVISPQVGPNKTRLGNKAMDIAPDLLRDPSLTGYSRGGVANKIQARFEQATEGLDVAADARLASQQVRTRPLLAELDKRIGELPAQPVEASKVTPTKTNLNSAGQETVRTKTEAVAYGKAVEPGPNTAELATLRQIRDEVGALGPVAPYESVRRIRQAWDKAAKPKYLPATAADALKSSGEATGAAKGTSAMREALAQTDPESAQAYQQYSLYKSAQDVVQAAEEADRVRPNRGRGIMARSLGAIPGAIEGNPVKAVIGATIGAIVDKAAEMAPTFQVVIARKLAAVADTLRSGDTVKARAMTDEIVQSFPAVRGGLRVIGKGSAMAGRAMAPVPLAADQQDQTGLRPKP